MQGIQVNLSVLLPNLIKAATGTNKIDQTLLLLLVYLCDWHSCVKYECRLTDIAWKVSRHGLSDVGLESFIRSNGDKFIIDDVRQEVCYTGNQIPNIEDQPRQIIDKVLAINKSYPYSGLATFVLSTYPILSSSSYTLEDVDLLKKADEYRTIITHENTDKHSENTNTVTIGQK